MSTEKTLLGLTNFVSVVLYAAQSIDIELLLVGKDDFGPIGFPSDIVYRPQNAFHLLIGCVADSPFQPTVGKTTFTSKPSPDRLVTYFKGHSCCNCAHRVQILTHGVIDVPKRNIRDSFWPPSWFARAVRFSRP